MKFTISLIPNTLLKYLYLLSLKIKNLKFPRSLDLGGTRGLLGDEEINDGEAKLVQKMFDMLDVIRFSRHSEEARRSLWIQVI